jgi:hypothetical protein
MAMLGFVLECAATAVLGGSVVGLLVWISVHVLRPLIARMRPGLRSDVLFLAGVVPAVAAVATVVAAAAPSVAMALGLGADHCPGHADHFHICFVHSAQLKPALAAFGVFGLAVWAYRFGLLARGLMTTGFGARALERLGRVRAGRFPVFVVPGKKLCHATGLLRRRVMLSSDLAARLSPDELTCALAHEEAHLCRRDPLARFMLAVAGLFVPPPLAASFRQQHRQAAEEACDAVAAAHVGDGATVAAALLQVAALQRATPDAGVTAAAFGGDGLEARVRALLDDRRSASARSHGPWLALGAASGLAWLALARADWLHHATETVLDRLF